VELAKEALRQNILPTFCSLQIPIFSLKTRINIGVSATKMRVEQKTLWNFKFWVKN